jgi:hypothetical protein
MSRLQRVYSRPQTQRRKQAAVAIVATLRAEFAAQRAVADAESLSLADGSPLTHPARTCGSAKGV